MLSIFLQLVPPERRQRILIEELRLKSEQQNTEKRPLEPHERLPSNDNYRNSKTA